MPVQLTHAVGVPWKEAFLFGHESNSAVAQTTSHLKYCLRTRGLALGSEGVHRWAACARGYIDTAVLYMQRDNSPRESIKRSSDWLAKLTVPREASTALLLRAGGSARLLAGISVARYAPPCKHCNVSSGISTCDHGMGRGSFSGRSSASPRASPPRLKCSARVVPERSHARPALSARAARCTQIGQRWGRRMRGGNGGGMGFE